MSTPEITTVFQQIDPFPSVGEATHEEIQNVCDQHKVEVERFNPYSVELNAAINWINGQTSEITTFVSSKKDEMDNYTDQKTGEIQEYLDTSLASATEHIDAQVIHVDQKTTLVTGYVTQVENAKNTTVTAKDEAIAAGAYVENLLTQIPEGSTFSIEAITWKLLHNISTTGNQILKNLISLEGFKIEGVH